MYTTYRGLTDEEKIIDCAHNMADMFNDKGFPVLKGGDYLYLRDRYNFEVLTELIDEGRIVLVPNVL
jgi:hypothetical protein